MSDCQAIADKVADLKQERSDLQAELHGLPGEPRPGPAQKAVIVAGIKKLTSKIEAKEEEHRVCLGLPVPLPTVTCPMAGATSTIVTSNSTFSGPFLLAVTPVLTFFSPRHARVDVAAMTTTIGPIPIPSSPCADMMTVAIPATSGTFDPVTGDMSIPISATLDHSLSGGLFNLLRRDQTRHVHDQRGAHHRHRAVHGVRHHQRRSVVAHDRNPHSGCVRRPLRGASQLAGTGMDLRITGTFTCSPLP